MKVPTTGTSVFVPDYNASFPQPGTVTTNFVADWDIYKRTSGSYTIGGTRFTGGNYLFFNETDAEYAGSSFLWDSNTSFRVASLAGSGEATVNWAFRRASGFFDVVCYTGTGAAQALSHNLGVAPELMIIKSRNTSGTNWQVYSRFTSTTYGYQTLQTDGAGNSGLTYGPGGSPNFESFTAAPTASVINLASSAEISANGRTYVAYLFATLAGVSKVGSYTGTAATQTINCGFTAGARFVLIKRTDSIGNWWVWDTARGMVSGTDQRIAFNTVNGQFNNDWVLTTSTGFQIVTTDPNLNASGGSYIFLAIA
jgi:hypothetical protein